MATQHTAREILIVDDDHASREMLARWFRTAGWSVTSAADCARAAEAAVGSSPAHAIVEQRLPDGSGLNLFRRLQAIHPRLSAVILTRYPSIAAAVQAIRLGFRDYLPKPVDWRHLASMFDVGTAPPALARPDATQTQLDGVPSLARAEWEHIQAALFACGGNVSAAARRLRVHRRSLQRKLQRVAPR